MVLIVISEMQFKIFLVISLAAVSCEKAVKTEPRDLFDYAEQVLDEYRLAITAALDKAENQLIFTQNDIRNIAQAIRSIATRIINNAYDDHMGQINEMEAKANDQGVNPKPCTYLPIREIIRWQMDIGAETDMCINGTLQESNLVLRDAFANVYEISMSVWKYYYQIQDCKTADDLVCLSVVISQLETQRDMLPIILDSDIQDVVNQFSSIDSVIGTCSSIATERMFAMGRTLLAGARECLENLLGSGK